MSTSEDDVFEVEKIVGSRLDKDGLRRVFRVRWKGCQPDEDTWEPKENLISCNDLLKQYKEERRRKKEHIYKKKRKGSDDHVILSKIKTEPNIEELDFNSTKKRDDLKSHNDTKNNSQKTNRTVCKRKRPELSLDMDLAGFTRKQRHEMERAVEESKMLSPVFTSDDKGVTTSDSTTNKISKFKKKKVRQIIEESSDDSTISSKSFDNLVTSSVDNALSYSCSSVLSSSSDTYVPLLAQLQQKSENNVISPENVIAKTIESKLKPTINLKNLSALKSKFVLLGQSSKLFSSSAPAQNTSSNGDSCNKDFSSENERILDLSSTEGNNEFHTKSKCVNLTSENISIKQENISKDLVRSDDVITSVNVVSQDTNKNKITDISSPSKVTIEKDFLKNDTNVLAQKPVASATSTSVEDSTSSSTKTLLSSVFSKIHLDLRKKPLIKKDLVIDKKIEPHVNIIAEEEKASTTEVILPSAPAKKIQEVGNETNVNMKISLEDRLNLDTLEKASFKEQTKVIELKNKTVLSDDPPASNQVPYKNVLETNQNSQKLNIDLSVFKTKQPSAPIAKQTGIVEDVAVSVPSAVFDKKSLKSTKSIKQTFVDKSKKLTYKEYQAKNRKKPAEHIETGLFLDFLKVPGGSNDISKQPNGADKAVVMVNPKASLQKVVTEKQKENFPKEFQLASTDDVLGTILETIGPIQECGPQLIAKDTNKELVRENEEDFTLEEASFEELVEESDFEYDLDDYSGDEDGFLMVASSINKKAIHAEIADKNTKILDLLVIHQAIVVGDTMTVIQSKIDCDDINRYVDDMDTLLMKAVMECSPDMVRILLEKSADPNTPSKNGKTPLMMAVELQQRSLVVMLIQNGAKMNIQTPSGETALILACKMGHIEIVHVLLNSGADVKPAATYLEKMAVPKHLRSSLQFALQIHLEKLKCVTEGVLWDIIKFDNLPIQIDHQLMGCRCISPDETNEHDFYFECDVYVRERYVQVIFLALPVLFERNGSVTPLFNAQKNGVQDVLLNNESMVQALPNSRYIYFLYPKYAEVNILRVLSDTSCTNKILVCVYAITFGKTINLLTIPQIAHIPAC